MKYTYSIIASYGAEEYCVAICHADRLDETLNEVGEDCAGMSEAKFTKAPWFVIKGDAFYEIGTSDDQYNSIQIADCCGSSVYFDESVDFGPTETANAYLIAASPDYYDEVEDLILWLGRMANLFPLGSSPLQSINARISRLQRLQTKARGEETA